MTPKPLQAVRLKSGFVAYSVIPGFRLSAAITLFFISLLILLPLSALALRPWELGWDGLLRLFSQPRLQAALSLSFGTSALAALTNTGAGLLVAYVLTRFRFPGKPLVDALVDLPFALPTAVAGVALTALYGPHGLIGEPLMQLGIKAAYSPLGIYLALVFIGLPFVVRQVQPVLADYEAELEEASATLGATPIQTFVRVVLPSLGPALLSGFALAFSRGLGEYGSVIFIAGNMPMLSEIAPLLIVIRLEEFDYAGAAAIGLIMLCLSFGALFLINLAQLMFAQQGRR